jgi:Domain of unknown function (DUF4258)
LPRHIIELIRDAIRNGNYVMTHHAIEEMADDFLSIYDVENAILSGHLMETQKGEPRGNKYVINGVSGIHATHIGVVGRFKETGVFLVLTVYAIYE